MPILDLHEDDLISASEAAPAVAPRKQDPAFSAWATVKSAVKAVPAAVAEVTGSTADILGAFGGVAAATGGSAGGMFSTGTEAERKQTADAAKKLREQGQDYRTEAGGLFRGVAKDYMPDATTAHGAEVAVADFVRMATKAVVGGVVAGPVAGALAAGAEEGFTAADKLADQGVDVNTRTQVGLVTGAVTGLGFALPVAGRTVGRTVGLALAGGPASFMAQNAATREILQRADYTQLADQYDPFDPVGLTLSTLVPLGFGALAMRGAARRAAAGQPVPDVAPVAPEVVDAARVQLLRENVDAHRATPPEDFAAAQAHEAAVAKALDQLANGQRVEVAQMVEITPEQRAANFSAWFGDSKVVGEDGAPLVVYHGTHDAFDSFDPQKIGSSTDPGYFGEGFYFTKSADEASSYTGLDGSNVMPVFVSLKNPFEMPSQSRFGSRDEWKAALKAEGQRLGVDLEGDPKAITEALKAAGHDGVVWRSAKGADEYVAFSAAQIKSAIGNSGRFDPNSPSLTDPVVQIAQRVAASLEPVRAELDALRAQVEQQGAAPVARAADDAAGTTPVTEPAQPAAAAQPARFDIDAIARQAADFLSDGRSPAEVIGRMQASGQTIAPELQNMIVGAAEFGRRMPELIDQFRALEARNAGAPPQNLIADAVDRMRAGQPVDAAPAKTSDVQARLDAEIVWNPDALDVKMPTAFDEAGKVSEAITAREFLDAVKAEADQEAADANLLQVAANCFLTSGA